MNRSGTADLPLHGGHVPPWLANRMTELGTAIAEQFILNYGQSGFLTRLSDPFWFQAYGFVMGMDWHSSGMTTSVLGAHSIRGYVGQDAKTTKFANDRQVTNFSVATKTFWKENGEDKNRTEWNRIVVWGNLSKKVAENLKKGQPVLVEGEIRTREYPKQVEVGKKKIEVKASITELERAAAAARFILLTHICATSPAFGIWSK